MRGKSKTSNAPSQGSKGLTLKGREKAQELKITLCYNIASASLPSTGCALTVFESLITICIFVFLQLSSFSFYTQEAAQQIKIARKRRANRVLNPKRSKIFGAKSNCETVVRVEIAEHLMIRLSDLTIQKRWFILMIRYTTNQTVYILKSNEKLALMNSETA